MQRVLVTGAGGYIGTTLVPLLLDAGYQVRAIDRFFFGAELLAPHEHLEVVQDDVRFLALEHFADVDFVIDLVAISNDPSGECFKEATDAINHRARVACATLAKQAGVKRYILPSSCSIYGFQEQGVICDEAHPTNPLTEYARANEKAEHGVLALSDEEFCVVVLRQATVFGASPRMRFDLAINGMTEGAWQSGKLPLLRDGTQWRPMVHVKDTAQAQLFILTAPIEKVNGQIFNVGDDSGNVQLGDLARRIAEALPKQITIEWYGEPDHRSYRVSFAKLRALGFTCSYSPEVGAQEIYAMLENGTLKKTPQTITLAWYQELEAWYEKVKALTLHGGMLNMKQ